MKFFKTALHPELGKNKEKSWQEVVKIFWGDREIPQYYFTSFSDTLNRIRDEYYRDLRLRNSKEYIHQKPFVEDNNNDSF